MTTNEKQPQTGMRLGYQIFARGASTYLRAMVSGGALVGGDPRRQRYLFLVWRYERVCLLDGYFKQIWSKRAQH